MDWFQSGSKVLCSAAAALALAGVGLGCGLMHQPTHLPVAGGEPIIPPPGPIARHTGSLWRDNDSANFPFSDARAQFPGDLLTILILENDQGSKTADTNTKTDTSVLGSLDQFFGLPQIWQKNDPNINPAALVQAQAKREWKGDGETTREGTLKATMTVEVKAVSPSGNLFVQGDKIILVNEEEQHVVLSGWVRPQDINAQNQVESTRLADARMEYYGIGAVGNKQNPGWGLQILDLVWPF
jgi:flagellar L-ring protein precursor FlgH